MSPRRHVDNVVGVLDVSTVKYKERSCRHVPANGAASMHLHVAVLAGVVEVAVGFIIELVVQW